MKSRAPTSKGATPPTVVLAKDISLSLRAESAHEKDDETDQQNQAYAATADGGPSQVKATTSEQEQQHNNQEQHIHARKIIPSGPGSYRVFTPSRFHKLERS
jgi:hypothetical protein